MAYTDQQNSCTYDESETPTVGIGVIRTALIGMACVLCLVGVLIWIF